MTQSFKKYKTECISKMTNLNRNTLIESLAHGYRVIPMESNQTQNLVVITRIGDQYHQDIDITEQVRFVPLQSGVE